MKTITYRFNDGTTSTVEVTDEIFEEHIKLKKARINNDRQNRRRHISMDAMLEIGEEVASTDDEPLNKIIQRIDKRKLYEAIKQLLPCQRKLLYRVYFKGEKQGDIANELGITKGSLNNRLSRILKKLKKLLV